MATHPQLRRALILCTALQFGFAMLVAAAPPAAAYYLSTVDITEAVTSTGPGLSLNPAPWARWIVHAFNTALTHQVVVTALQCQAGLYQFMVGVALWLLGSRSAPPG